MESTWKPVLARWEGTLFFIPSLPILPISSQISIQIRSSKYMRCFLLWLTVQPLTMCDFWNNRYSRNFSVLQREPNNVLRNLGFKTLHNLWLKPFSASLGELLSRTCISSFIKRKYLFVTFKIVFTVKWESITHIEDFLHINVNSYLP